MEEQKAGFPYPDYREYDDFEPFAIDVIAAALSSAAFAFHSICLYQDPSNGVFFRVFAPDAHHVAGSLEINRTRPRVPRKDWQLHANILADAMLYELGLPTPVFRKGVMSDGRLADNVIGPVDGAKPAERLHVRKGSLVEAEEPA